MADRHESVFLEDEAGIGITPHRFSKSVAEEQRTSIRPVAVSLKLPVSLLMILRATAS